MTAQRHFIFWTMTFAAFLAIVIIFRSVLTPFALGMVIAYFLNPAVNALARYKIGRGLGAVLILVLFFLVLGAVIAAIAPTAYREIVDLGRDIPIYIQKARALFESTSDRIEDMLGTKKDVQVEDIVTNNSATAVAVASTVASRLLQGGQAVMHAVTLVVITPFVAFFMMMEWTRITAWIENVLPRQHKNTILGLLGQIDRKLSGFIRGQVLVACALGFFYALTLSIAGLKYGFLIGLMSGVLSIIPLVGSTTGLLVSVTVAWFQSGSWEYPLVVGSIFIFGQLVEGNILTPKIIGDRVGLHPLWVFFALMAGGSLLGFLGLLIAVPVAAVVSVLLGFLIRQYKFSPYFRGPEDLHA